MAVPVAVAGRAMGCANLRIQPAHTPGISMTAPTRARLTIRRQSPDDIQQREVFVSLDGIEFAILRYGDSVTRDVEPGSHDLRVHNTLFRQRLPLHIAPGEDVRFQVTNRPGWGTYALMSVLGAGPLYLKIEREQPEEARPESG
jgi:hypothetical protein